MYRLPPGAKPRATLCCLASFSSAIFGPKSAGGRFFWMCMIYRTSPQTSAVLVFTETEMQLLDQVDPKPSAAPKKTASDYRYAVARLRGYLSRALDPPPTW
jgi:hypothetical protein